MDIKKSNAPDVKITADADTLQWLAKVFGCSEPDAVNILLIAAGKKRGADGKS